MASVDFIRRQLLAIRKQVSECASRQVNVHFQICNTLNGLRVSLIDVLDTLQPDLATYVEDFIQPVKTNEGNPPYPEQGSVALLVTDRLLEACNEVIGATIKATAGSQVPSLNIPGERSVFIVHGHDEVNLLRLERLMEKRWKLSPIILMNSASTGNTVIEKFEHAARTCTYAFVLLTPDDLVATKTGSISQARPNVIFELGWFYGRLGRNRVCILYKSGTSIHSDLAGIVRIEFAANVDEKISEIEAELRAAGLLEAPDQSDQSI